MTLAQTNGPHFMHLLNEHVYAIFILTKNIWKIVDYTLVNWLKWWRKPQNGKKRIDLDDKFPNHYYTL